MFVLRCRHRLLADESNKSKQAKKTPEAMAKAIFLLKFDHFDLTLFKSTHFKTRDGNVPMADEKQEGLT